MRKLVLVVILITLSIPLAGAAPASAYLPYAVEEPVGTGAGVGAPSVWGMNAARISAWESNSGNDWDVFVRGLDGAVAIVPLGSTDQRHPVFQDSYDSKHVVYEHDPLGTGDWDIFASDVSALLAVPGGAIGPELPIATGPGRQIDPDCSGNWVVYEDDSRGNWDICAYNIVTGVRRRIVSNTAAQRDPAIFGDHVAFADRRNGNWDIYDYDLSTGKLKRLTTDRSSQTMPQVGQGIVVYQDHRNGNWDIYACSPISGRERRLTTDPHDQTTPSLDRAYTPSQPQRSVVYQDSRDGNADIYVCQLKTGISKPVTDDPGPQTEPALDGSHVVWRDGRPAAPGIYGCRLSFPGVSLLTPSGTPAYNSDVEVSGSLALQYGAWVGQRVYVNDRGTKRWVTLPGPSTFFTVLIPNVVRKVTLSAVYPGDSAHLPAASSSIVIKPQARLTTPVLKGMPDTDGDDRWDPPHDLTVSGYLKPRHPAGTKAVSIHCYVFQRSGNPWWKYVKTVKATVTDYSSYSKYRGTVKLEGGPWKVRASHYDADHAFTESGYSDTVLPLL